MWHKKCFKSYKMYIKIENIYTKYLNLLFFMLHLILLEIYFYKNISQKTTKQKLTKFLFINLCSALASLVTGVPSLP